MKLVTGKRIASVGVNVRSLNLKFIRILYEVLLVQYVLMYESEILV